MEKSVGRTTLHRAGLSSTSAFAFRRPPPSRRSLLRTLPLAPASNIPPILEWGNPPTEIEALGLSGLGEFVSGIKPPVLGLSVAQRLLVKRRRSIGERSHDLSSSLVKKPRFAIPPVNSPRIPNTTASPKVHAAALSVLNSKSSTKKHGSVRLRLGLSKRANLGSKLAQNQSSDESYDVSVQVKLIPRRQLGPGPSRTLPTESSGAIDSSSGALTFGLDIPDKMISTAQGEKIHLHLPVGLAALGALGMNRPPSTPQSLSTSSTSDVRGTVLVPASPSPLGRRLVDVSDTLPEDLSLDSRVDTTMLSESVPESPIAPSHGTTSYEPNTLPSFHGSVLSSTPASKALVRRNPLEADSVSATPDVLISASLSLSLEESEQQASSVRNDAIRSVPRPLNQTPVRPSSGITTSVLYSSSPESDTSKTGSVVESPSPLAQYSSTHGHYESIPWDLSQLEEISGDLQHNTRDSSSPSSALGKDLSTPVNNSGIPDQSISLSDPRNQQTNPTIGMISTLYNSSQDSSPLRPGSQNITSKDQSSLLHQNENLAPTPVPSWFSSSDTSPRSRSHFPLSGARPSASWGSPLAHRLSPDDLVAASRSLSLEDFDIQGQSTGRQSRNPALAHSPLAQPHSLSADSAQLVEPVPGDETSSKSPSFAANTSVGMRSGMTRLASYASTQGSFLEPHSPILSFTPLLKERAPDDSIESIDSFPTQSLKIGGSSKRTLIPKFRLPVPEPQLDEDISFESQIPRAKEQKSPPHGSQLARTNNEGLTRDVIDSQNNGIRDDHASSELAPSDQVQAPDRRSSTGSAETENVGARKVPSLEEFPSAPNPPRSVSPQPPPALPLTSKIYKGHLHKVIPQPHFLPSPPCPPPSLTEGMLATLGPPRFQNWLNKDGTPAHDQVAAAASFASNAWGRAAWIVPVRGRAPWEGCSGAVVSLRPIKERKKLMVVWTPAAIRSFWAQMTGFRDSKRVGSLSLSFEPAPGKPPGLEAPRAAELKGSRNFEFIKLYHDTRVSLHLRTILQVLEFADEDEYDVDADAVIREGGVADGTTRRLLGASTRLALLDDTGHIVLVS